MDPVRSGAPGANLTRGEDNTLAASEDGDDAEHGSKGQEEEERCVPKRR
jgi:ribosomal protein L27